MSKQSVWEQYKEEKGDNAYSNSQFSYYLYKWESHQKTVMKLGSKPGELLRVNYAGDKLKYIEKESGELKQGIGKNEKERRFCKIYIQHLSIKSKRWQNIIYCRSLKYP